MRASKKAGLRRSIVQPAQARVSASLLAQYPIAGAPASGNQVTPALNSAYEERCGTLRSFTIMVAFLGCFLPPAGTVQELESGFLQRSQAAARTTDGE